MIEHVYRRAAEARGVSEVIVATDDRRIADVVTAFGGTFRMTSPEHRTGTDRLAEVVAGLTCDIVVNVQGDLPLLDPGMVEQAAAPLLADPELQMGTACTPIASDDDYLNPNVVKVVRDARGDALYFSRAPIPHFRGGGSPRGSAGIGAFKHIGLYAYRRSFVPTFAALRPTPLEIAESHEQLI
jgi:3-deoxy-manno-octulosonate cytidylyltransferase (CMP-KDO synthetase)